VAHTDVRTHRGVLSVFVDPAKLVRLAPRLSVSKARCFVDNVLEQFHCACAPTMAPWSALSLPEAVRWKLERSSDTTDDQSWSSTATKAALCISLFYPPREGRLCLSIKRADNVSLLPTVTVK
jgi:hypothetical protein